MKYCVSYRFYPLMVLILQIHNHKEDFHRLHSDLQTSAIPFSP